MIYSFHGLYCCEKSGQKNRAMFVKSQKSCLYWSLLRIFAYKSLLKFCLWVSLVGGAFWWVQDYIFFFVRRSPKWFCLRSNVWLLVRPAEIEEPLVWVLAEIAALVLMCNEDNKSKGLGLLNPVINSWVILEWSANLFKVFLQNSALFLLCFYILLGDKVRP